MREKHSDPKLAYTVSVDIIKLDLKANQTVNVMAFNQKKKTKMMPTIKIQQAQ